MSRKGQKLPKDVDASRGARNRRPSRHPAEEVEDLLQDPHRMAQGAPQELPGTEPPVPGHLYSNTAAQSGPEVGATASNQPWPYSSQGAPVDDSLFCDQEYFQSSFQEVQGYDSLVPGPLYPNGSQIGPLDDHYQQGTNMHVFDAQQSYIPDGRVQPPMDSQGRHFQDTSQYYTTCGDVMSQSVEGISCVNGLKATNELPLAFGSTAPTSVTRGSVPPSTRQRRGREKKTFLYELEPQKDKEMESSRQRSIRQRKVREKQKAEKQKYEDELLSLSEEIAVLSLERDRLSQSVGDLEAEEERSNMPQGHRSFNHYEQQ